ncbi:hypothetical protein K488DRAFT_44797 [Vararia minispora EC-137]|uniref:Uncharacterized protein n=1 Tax=Vararia minispora EC-137 TaxID=1314806 RepID=A0ACB8QSX1_9AGAM|nr:hypothetical protein K488DRAFT_44797 [Vararia minispora EC-137]
MTAPLTRPSEKRSLELVENLTEIRERVRQAAGSSHASPPALVAVSKYKPAADILVCYDAGQRDFGENYVQELVDKAEALPRDIRWHFIGTLQSNKAKILASIPNIYSVQTVTSAKAASGLNKALHAERAEPLNVLLQVNTSGEDNKSGLVSTGDELAALARHVLAECPRLRLHGLMTIGSLSESLEAGVENRDFAMLVHTRDTLQGVLRAEFGGEKLSAWGDGAGRLLLSMGMSSDFEAALKAGSDIVRVGTGIFGERHKKGEQKGEQTSVP